MLFLKHHHHFYIIFLTMFGATKTSLPSKFSFLIKIYVLFCQCFIHLFYSSRLGVALFWVQAMFQTDFQSNGDTHGEYIMRIRLHDLENSLVQYHIQKTQIRLKKKLKTKAGLFQKIFWKSRKGWIILHNIHQDFLDKTSFCIIFPQIFVIFSIPHPQTRYPHNIISLVPYHFSLCLFYQFS